MLTAEQRRDWDEKGYLAIPGFFDSSTIDRITARVEAIFADPPGYLVVDSTVTGQRTRLADLPVGDRLPRNFKLNDLYLEEPAIRDAAIGDRVRGILSVLLGEPIALCNSLNFEKGSGQPEHIDSLFMTPRTPGQLAATWIALEDAHPDAGQLFYYPGSHKIPLYTFSDGSHHAQDDEMPKWHDYIREKLKAGGFQEERFPAKKGDLFIWSANLVHGGSTINDPNRTRKSLVCHYYGIRDSRELKLDCIPVGDNGYWVKREHPPLPGAIPFRQKIGKWLRKIGLYRTVKKLVGKS